MCDVAPEVKHDSAGWLGRIAPCRLSRRNKLGGWVAAFAAVSSAIVAVIGISATPEVRAVLWGEVAKGFIQLTVIAVLGGVVSLAFRAIDQDRETRRSRDLERLAIFQRLTAAYHQLRSARRDMKFAGLHLIPPIVGSTDASNRYVGRVSPLRSEQVEVLRDGLRQLADVQLALDQVNREISVSSSFDDPGAITGPLEKLTTYVEAIVREWQNHGLTVWPDQPPDDIAVLVLLREFLADRKVSYACNVSVPFQLINDCVRKLAER